MKLLAVATQVSETNRQVLKSQNLGVQFMKSDKFDNETPGSKELSIQDPGFVASSFGSCALRLRACFGVPP